MIDMKRMPEPKPTTTGSTMLTESACCPEGEKPSYPWGLKIRLEKEELAKLGITEANLPKVGEMMKVAAYAQVSEVSVQQMQSGGNEVCVYLQIEQMELGVEGPSIAERMYGKS